MNKYLDLTNSQENIYEVEKSLLTSNNACNILLVSIKFSKNLNFYKLEKTLNKIIELNDSFRIRFIEKDGTIMQYITDYVYEQIDLLEFNKEREFTNYINALKEKSINIYNKLYDFKVVKYNKETYVIYKVHHIINDAWGMTQVAEQIKELYPIIENVEVLEKIKKQSYIEVIKNNEQYNISDKYKVDKEFWNEYVKNLSTEKIYNKDISENKAARVSVIINKDITSKIKNYCKLNKITEYTFFLAVISIYYYKIHSINNLNIGTPFINRNKKELNNIGLFVSNLPLNVQINENDLFLEVCNIIYKNNFKLFRHSKFPYTKIQKLYADINYATNMYEIGFSYQINALSNKLNGDLGKTEWYFTNYQNNPITIHVSQMNGVLEIFYDYIITLFQKKDIENIHCIIMHIIKQVINSQKIAIRDINVITELEKKKLLKFNNTGKVKLNEMSISDLFDVICKKHSNRIAMKHQNKEITYKEFYKKVCDLAYTLRKNEVKRNAPVVLIFDKSIEMIIAMFAVIKAGGYYIPILPEENEDRMEYIINDSNPLCILTSKVHKDLIKNRNVIIVDEEKLGNLPNKINNINSCNDIIYLIYTSGSTGNPKGTKLLHKNVYSLLYSINEDNNIKASKNDISMSLLKYSFDASGIDIYTSILNGGKLILISKDDELDPKKIIKIMQKEKVTRSFLVPKWIEHINNIDNEINADLSNLKILGTGGETLKPKLVEHLFNKYKDLKILNLYGPTETTMFSTYSIIDKDNIETNCATIGKPIKYSRALIVNDFGDIMPTNTKGELVIYEDAFSLKNISNGYLNLKELTETKFQNIRNVIKKNEFIDIYKTGDIAKINNKLQLEYIGRTDNMVKVNNGYLVSINEVEAKVNKIIGNKYQFCIIDINTNTTKSLILFIKSSENDIDATLIKKHINNNLSFFMRIKEVIAIPEFPVNNSGKIDKKKLRESAKDILNYKKIILPKTETESKIYNLIKNQFNLNNFSIKDDFMDDLGLDSLNMSILHSHLNNSRVLMQDLYTYSNVEELSNLIDQNIINVNEQKFNDLPIKNNTSKFNLKQVLLTGATGFLGIHILFELLNNKTVKKIYCLIRSKENISSKDRLFKKISYYFNLTEELKDKLNEKLIVIDGDLIKDKFGLKENEYIKLQKNITTVINCAANVRHYAKYNQLYETNVNSVDNILRFCKKDISLAHMSTLSIAGFKGDNTKNIIYDENTLYINQEFYNNPYLITKYYAEEKILKSNDNSKIFRLGNIMPRLRDGKFQENYSENAFLNAIALMTDIKKIAKEYLEFRVEFSPVDECSKSIINILETNDNSKVYHIVNENEIKIKELINMLDYIKIDIVDKQEFLITLNNYKQVGSQYIKEYILQNNLNKYSIENTLKVLNMTGFKWEKTNHKYIAKIRKIIENNRW